MRILREDCGCQAQRLARGAGAPVIALHAGSMRSVCMSWCRAPRGCLLGHVPRELNLGENFIRTIIRWAAKERRMLLIRSVGTITLAPQTEVLSVPNSGPGHELLVDLRSQMTSDIVLRKRVTTK